MMVERESDIPETAEVCRTVAIAQAKEAFFFTFRTVPGSIVITLLLLAMQWETPFRQRLFPWAACALFFELIRSLGMALAIRKDLSSRYPHQAMAALQLSTFVMGSLHAMVLLLLQFSFGRPMDLLTVLVLVGGVGAASASVPVGFTDLSYNLPILAVITYCGFATGTLTAHAIAVGNVVYGGYLIVNGIITARTAKSKLTLDLKTQLLATSLASANSEIRQANELLYVQARHDALTGLGNRAEFLDRLNHAIVCSANGSTQAQVVLFLFGLDHLKAVNDTLGHMVGDRVLVEAAQRLQRALSLEKELNVECLARLSGDEFAAVVVCPPEIASVQQIGQRLLHEISGASFEMDGCSVVMRASCGFAIYPSPVAAADELLSAADLALNAAKGLYRGRVRSFDASLREAADRRRRLETDLGPALQRKELEVYFQPQIHLPSQKVTGFEALIRWTHPRLGPVSPPDIVAAARFAHVSEKLTEYVLERACLLLQQFDLVGCPNLVVAINLSPQELSLYSVANMVANCLSRHGISPSRLEIELTEEVLLEPELTMEELDRLKAVGVGLALDDFGAGHTSLAYLRQNRFDTIKIDRQYISALGVDQTNLALVQAIIGFGQTLEVNVIAEGVETEKEAKALVCLGCRRAQGYLFGRPMPVGALWQWMGERGFEKPADGIPSSVKE